MLLLQLGQRLSDQDLRAMIAAVDLDGSGEIEFDEFLVMIKNKAKMDAIKEGKPVHQISYRDYGVRTFCSVNKPSEPRQSVRRRENATSMKPEYGHATTKNGAWVVPVGLHYRRRPLKGSGEVEERPPLRGVGMEAATEFAPLTTTRP